MPGRLVILFISPLTATAWAKVDFNEDVRPILSENCFYCHGPDGNKRKAKLRLDVREAALEKKAFVPGDEEASELIKRLASTDSDEVMPPPDSHRTLTTAQKETLKRWIAEGAEYKPHWAYVPPVRPALPSNGAKYPIDAFVVEKLAQASLKLSPEAPKATLLRRVTLDLTGLPPTPEETATFLADQSPDAYEKQVERLLASPHYGERMVLPWLDASRYADSNGFQQDGDTFQWVWRDWLVKSLNADKPFDQLSTEMLAGDLLPNATLDQKIATAFNRNHILNGEGGTIAEEQRFVSLFDRVESTTTTWLGLTVACAQCHDHKYDPITQKDYYQWMDAFNQVNERGTPSGGPSRFRLDTPVMEAPTPEQAAELAKLQANFDALNKDFSAHQAKAFEAWIAKPTKDKGMLPKELEALLTPEMKRTAAQTEQLRDHYNKNAFAEDRKKFPAIEQLDRAKQLLDGFRGNILPRVMVMSDDQRRDTHILDRGAYLSKKEKVTFDAPGFLPPLPKDAPKNRLGLAQWLFRPEHPLTARVQVNRQWQHFFGHGIVRTSEDLGVQSDRPTHPALLDWLAVEFRESGWKTKALHRLIVTSRTYRQSSHVTKEHLQKDPENKLLARAPRLRLPSLLLRDVALSSSGLLNAQIGGMPVYPYLPDSPWESLAITRERDFTYPQSKGADLYRRSLYTFWRRTIAPVNMFDSSARQTCRVRTAVTSSPLHALTMLNDPTWVEAARVLAQRVTKEQLTDEARLARAFALVLGRAPAGPEPVLLAKMLANQRAVYAADAPAAAALLAIGESQRDAALPFAEHAALTATCLALYNLDLAVTRD